MLFYTFLAVLLAVASAFNPGSLCNDCECRKLSGDKLLVTKCRPQIQLTESTFQNISRKDAIHVVSIDEAYIQSIDANTFAGFINLQDVVIRNTKIGSIAPNVFDRVAKVSFTNCGFEDNPNLTSKRLEELKMVKCQLNTIPEFDLDKLITLNLSDNSINKINLLDFVNMKEVEDIDLSHNQIKTFPSDVFVNNDELNTVTMDFNPLEEFIINTTNSIELLSLKGCKLTAFDFKSTKYLDNLSELYLNDNDITSLFGIDMAYLIELQIFDISNNKLTVLDPDVFENNTQLEKITLDGNQLQFLPLFVSAYDRRFRTYLFSCNNCGLKSYVSPMVFHRMSALYELRLANNELTNINGTFDQIPSLAIVDVSNNKLKSIAPQTFKKNVRIETIKLNGNLLQSLDASAFDHLANLDRIEADDNLMTQLWSNKDKVSIPTLKALCVRHNGLKAISTDELEVTPHLVSFAVDGNPLDCNQKLMSMITWLARNVVAPPQLTHMEMRDSLGLIDSPSEGSLWRNLTAERCPNMLDAYDQLDNEINKEFNGDKDSEKIEDEIPRIEEVELTYAKAEPVTKKDEEYLDEDYYDDQEDEEEEDEDATIKPIIASIEEVVSVRYASYILSLTTVFVLTALLVLFVAVAVILLILKRNGSINMHTANIPRFKIPTWSQTTGIKKHSGSIYRPLSEDLSPPTPHLKKYEFSTSPSVHTLP